MPRFPERIPDACDLVFGNSLMPSVSGIGLPMHPFQRTVEYTDRGCQVNLRVTVAGIFGFARISILDEDYEVGARISAEMPEQLFYMGAVTKDFTSDGYRLITGAVGHIDGMSHTIGRAFD